MNTAAVAEFSKLYILYNVRIYFFPSERLTFVKADEVVFSKQRTISKTCTVTAYDGGTYDEAEFSYYFRINTCDCILYIVAVYCIQ